MQRTRPQIETIQNEVAGEDRANDEELTGGKTKTEDFVHA